MLLRPYLRIDFFLLFFIHSLSTKRREQSPLSFAACFIDAGWLRLLCASGRAQRRAQAATRAGDAPRAWSIKQPMLRFAEQVKPVIVRVVKVSRSLPRGAFAHNGTGS